MWAQFAIVVMMPTFNCSWTIHFDTVYATQDVADDERIGVKSTARLFGDHVKAITSSFAGSSVLLMLLAGIFTNRGPLFYAISCVGAAIHFTWQMWGWNVKSRSESMRIFMVSVSYHDHDTADAWADRYSLSAEQR
jgi:4-hydroxybenzoate polyprenyltransferase